MTDNAYYESRLRDYIETNRVPAEQLVFAKSCHSVAEAAEAAGVTRQDFVKSICFITDADQLIVAIVKGEDRASASRVARACGCASVRTADPDEMLARTGYPCGGTPAFGYAADFFIDERVFKTEIVYSGGGSENALLRMRSADLPPVNGARIARLRS